jgi:Rieske Fe-S protein
MTDLTRRTLMTTGGAAVLGSGALLLAGCAPAPLRTDPGTNQGTGSGPGQVPPAQIPVASPLPSGTPISDVSDIPVGGSTAVTVDGQDFLLAQPSQGTVVAFSAICTHQGCLVAAAGAEFDCSCHGSRFEAATGAVLNGPAVRPLVAVEVEVVDGAVVIA